MSLLPASRAAPAAGASSTRMAVLPWACVARTIGIFVSERASAKRRERYSVGDGVAGGATPRLENATTNPRGTPGGRCAVRPSSSSSVHPFAGTERLYEVLEFCGVFGRNN